MLLEIILQPQLFAKFGITFNTFHLRIDDNLCIRFYLVIITFDLLHHDILPVIVSEFINDRDRFICLLLRADLCMVDDDLRMKDFWSIFSPKLSDTAPTKVPCERFAILEAGIRESSCVLIEVDTS